MELTAFQIKLFEEQRVCDHCGARGAGVKLRRKLTASGSSIYAWWCLDCDRPAHAERVWIPKTMAATYMSWVGRTIDEIPLVSDDRLICEMTGDPGAELHHWLPQATAELAGEDADDWPMAYLRTDLHRLWHDLVTWYMPGTRRTDALRTLLIKYRSTIESILVWAYGDESDT